MHLLNFIKIDIDDIFTSQFFNPGKFFRPIKYCSVICIPTNSLIAMPTPNTLNENFCFIQFNSQRFPI